MRSLSRLLTAIVVTATGKDTLCLSLPAWSPGAYEIQNYARYVRAFGATSPAGQPLFGDRFDKDTWRVVTGKGALDVQSVTPGSRSRSRCGAAARS